MPLVRPISKVAEKWGTVTPQRAPQYEEGVKSPLKDWAKQTAAANDAYKAGVQAAVQKDMFAKGVAKAGTAKWQAKAAALGPRRFSEGVAMSAPDYEKGFAPYRDVIEKTTLPPRFAKGDPRNIDRVRTMAAALAEAKRR